MVGDAMSDVPHWLAIEAEEDKRELRKYRLLVGQVKSLLNAPVEKLDERTDQEKYMDALQRMHMASQQAMRPYPYGYMGAQQAQHTPDLLEQLTGIRW